MSGVLENIFQYLLAHPDRTNAIAAVSSSVIAITTLLIAIVSIFVSVKALKIQDRHNQLSVRPIPRINLQRKYNKISVYLQNNGFGPLIIKSYEITNQGEIGTLMAFLPDPPNGMKCVGGPTSVTKYATVSPSASIPILELETEINDLNARQFVEKIRVTICNLKFKIIYTDMYGNIYETYERHFNSEITAR